MGNCSSTKYLAGTVAIPSSFPEVAKIVYRESVRFEDGGKLVDVLQSIESNPHQNIVRMVSLRDVVAVFVAPDTDPNLMRRAWLDPCNWFTESEEIKAAIGKKQQNGTRRQREKGDHQTANGIVYVKENVRVLMQVEFGMTAADCAEYYPPALRAGYCPPCGPPCC